MDGRMGGWEEDADWVGAFALVYLVLEYECRRLAARANPPAFDRCDPGNRLRRETYGRWTPSFMHAVVCAALAWAEPGSRARDVLVLRHTLGYFAADSWVDRDPVFYVHHAALYVYYLGAKWASGEYGGKAGGMQRGGGPSEYGELGGGAVAPEIGFGGLIAAMRAMEAGNVVSHGVRLLGAVATDSHMPRGVRAALRAHTDALKRIGLWTFVASRVLGVLRSARVFRADIPPELRPRFAPVALACMVAVLWSNVRAIRDDPEFKPSSPEPTSTVLPLRACPQSTRRMPATRPIAPSRQNGVQ